MDGKKQTYYNLKKTLCMLIGANTAQNLQNVEKCTKLGHIVLNTVDTAELYYFKSLTKFYVKCSANENLKHRFLSSF